MFSSLRFGKADGPSTKIPSGVNVLQEDIPKNPKSCTKVSFIIRKVIRGQVANLPVRDGFEIAPAIQTLLFPFIGPRLNVAGEIVTADPPIETEMEVLKLQGTVIEESNIVIDGITNPRTGVHAITNRLCTELCKRFI